jgi:hypothetical protein
MTKVEIKIFEPNACGPGCGCGSASDEILLKFSETLKMIEKKYGQDVSIEKGSINQNSSLFFNNQDVLVMINEEGMQTLPITKIDGNIVFKGVYPTFEMLDAEIKSVIKLKE